MEDSLEVRVVLAVLATQLAKLASLTTLFINKHPKPIVLPHQCCLWREKVEGRKMVCKNTLPRTVLQKNGRQVPNDFPQAVWKAHGHIVCKSGSPFHPFAFKVHFSNLCNHEFPMCFSLHIHVNLDLQRHVSVSEKNLCRAWSAFKIRKPQCQRPVMS